ncbi:hypothetical protein ACFWSJ_15825 [Streptomyces niveus]|uniref:hypothetical protein n=1 Tax=Streptomyces niveus TaxID=193462 RepID=UPI00365AB3EB
MPQPNQHVYWDGYSYQYVSPAGPRDTVAVNGAMYGMPAWVPGQETPQQAQARAEAWRRQQQIQQAQAWQYAQAQAQAWQQQRQQARAQADAMAYQRYQVENQGRVQAWLRDVPTGASPDASNAEGARASRPPGEPGRSGGHGRRGKGQGRRS